jgi:serine/threonine-protein kinase RsbW
VVTTLAEEAGLPQEEVDKIEVAVDEACANVLEHAYESLAPPPPVQLHIQTDEQSFVIDIVDEGETFDFNSHTLPTFPDHWYEGHTRGVGLFLIRQCVDAVEYDRVNNTKNRLRLIKRIPC